MKILLDDKEVLELAGPVLDNYNPNGDSIQQIAELMDMRWNDDEQMWEDVEQHSWNYRQYRKRSIVQSCCAKCGGTGFIGDGVTAYNKQKCDCGLSYYRKKGDSEWIPFDNSSPIIKNPDEYEFINKNI